MTITPQRVLVVAALCSIVGIGSAHALCVGAAGIPFNCTVATTPQPADLILGGQGTSTVRFSVQQLLGAGSTPAIFPSLAVTGNATVGGTITGGTISGTNVSGANVTATGATTAQTLAVRAGRMPDVRDFGAVGDGTTDDQTAFQGAAYYGENQTQTGNIHVSAGTYFLSGMVYTQPKVTWLIDSGVAFAGTGRIDGNIGGATSASGYSIINTTSAIPWNTLYIAQVFNSSTTPISSQRNGIYLDVLVNDTVNPGAVGMENKIGISGSTGGSIWAYHAIATVNTGADAYVPVEELELQNFGVDQPQVDQNNSKIGMHLVSRGTANGTAGVVFSGSTADGGTPKWHIGMACKTSGVLGNCWEVVGGGPSFPILANLDMSGNLTAATLTQTGSEPASEVLAAPTGAAGAPTWRQLAVADVTGAAPLASPTFTTGVTVTSASVGPGVVSNYTGASAQKYFAGTNTDGSWGVYDETQGGMRFQIFSAGYIIVGQHLQASAALAPTIAANACGSVAQGTVSGTDQSMLVTIGTTAVTSCAVTFAALWSTAPHCVFSAASATASAAYMGTPLTSGFTLQGAALTGSYQVVCQ